MTDKLSLFVFGVALAINIYIVFRRRWEWLPYSIIGLFMIYLQVSFEWMFKW